MSDEQTLEEHQTFMWVVAHPDDAEFPSAGTITKLVKEGKKVVIVQVTSGQRGTADLQFKNGALQSTREDEEREAARRMGVEDVVFLGEPDGMVEASIALREKITRQIRTFKPDVIATHDPFRPYALHPDHRAVGYATTDSVYPTARDYLYFPEHLESGLEPHKVKEIWYYGAAEPNLFIDITDTFETKILALQAHVTQVGHREQFAERLRERAADLAKDQPFELAEAYYQLKLMR